jgi:hypothetical protein
MSYIFELPAEEQSALRDLIVRNGGAFVAFVGAGIQLALPRHDVAFVRALAEEGLRIIPGTVHRREIQLANPEPELCHDSPCYPGEFRFWKLAEFAPIA